MHDFETSLLGCLLTKNSCFDEISDFITVEDFQNKKHAELYRTIKKYLSDGVAFDAVMAINVLEHNAMFVEINISKFIFEITASVYSIANIRVYADNIKKISTDSKMVEVAQEIITSVNHQVEDRLDLAQKKILAISDSQVQEVVMTSEIVDAVMEIIDDRANNKGKKTGLETGFTELDKITNGFQNGDLIIIAGRPSMGKTLFALNIAEHAAINNGKTILFFSLEMNKEQLLERTFSRFSSVNAAGLRSGNLNNLDFERITTVLPKIRKSKLLIDDRSAIGVSDIRAKCRRVKREHGLSLVVIDYITLMKGDGENETLRIGNITRGLKLLARDLNVPVIAISQLNRGVETQNKTDRRPTMAHLRQSGAIEQDADLILFVYRDEVYNQETHLKGLAEIIIAKHRNGSIGMVPLVFAGHFCRFEDYAGMYDRIGPKRAESSDRSFQWA